MWSVVLLLLEVALTCASTHSLTYFFTAVSGDIDFPEFTIVGLVNEEQFIYFDSNTKKVVPKTEWMKQKEGAEYWDTQTKLAAGTRHVFRNNIQVAKDRFNHSTVSPQVSLLQKSPSSPVTCHATGFYPKGETITWMRNGQEHRRDVDLGELLPNEDGTFQRTSTFIIPSDKWKNKYSCVVKHQGQTIRKILSEKEIKTNRGDSVPVGIIVSAVVLLIIIGVIGYMVYLKKRGEDGQL